jgi:tetratricopeptide (TPR) repeat protein
MYTVCKCQILALIIGPSVFLLSQESLASGDPARNMPEDVAIRRATQVLERESARILDNANQWIHGAFATLNSGAIPTSRLGMLTGQESPDLKGTYEAMQTLVKAHTKSPEPYCYLGALEFSTGSPAAGRAIFDQALEVLPESGICYYFRAACSAALDEKSQARDDLLRAIRFLDEESRSLFGESAENLLEKVTANPTGTTWKAYFDPRRRFSIEYPADWEVYDAVQFRKFMAGRGFALPEAFERQDGVIVVCPYNFTALSVEIRSVKQLIPKEEVKALWQRAIANPKDMERKHATIYPGFHVLDMTLDESPTAIRQETRFEFPLNILNREGRVLGRKAAVFQTSNRALVAMCEYKSWSQYFAKMNSKYVDRMISSLQVMSR